MTIPQALALIGFLSLLLDDGFRVLFFSALGVVLFWAATLGMPVFLWALIVSSRVEYRADPRPGSGTWLLFVVWWAACLFTLVVGWLASD